MEFIDYAKKFEEFYQNFKKLSFVEANIVFTTLQYMEHHFNIKDIDIKRGINIARIEQDLSLSELISIIDEEATKKQNDTKKYSRKDAYKTMLRRNSMGSFLFPIVLEILNIDKKYIIRESEFFQEKFANLEWLYNSLSDDNKNAINYLVYGLLNKEDIEKSLTRLHCRKNFRNIGLETD